jgi:hypothetical protein
LHEPFGKQRRLVPRALWLPGRIAGLPLLKPMFQICDCIFSHTPAFLNAARIESTVRSFD